MANRNYSSGVEKVEYLFIDAGYLNARVKHWSKYFEKNEIEIDYETLVKGYDKIFYYDGVSDKDDNKRISLNNLREISDFHVFTGRVKGKGKNRKQKQVDILIAVDMLSHTIRNNMDSCTLLAGDEDFKPLVDALIREGMNVTIWYEKDSVNDLLLYAADRKKHFTVFDIWKNSTQKFQDLYPLPKITTLSPMQAHQLKFKYAQKGTIANRQIFKLQESDHLFEVALENESNVSLTKLTFSSEEKLAQYLHMLDENGVIWK